MDTLLHGGGSLSGPHYYQQLTHATGHNIVLMGENHKNENSCPNSGHDVVDVIKQCVREGAYVYLELNTRYENGHMQMKETCKPKPVSGPRADVLNELRICMLAMRDGNDDMKRRISFVDIREIIARLPYTVEEEKLLQEIIELMNSGNQKEAVELLETSFMFHLRRLYMDRIQIPNERFRYDLLHGTCPWQRVLQKHWQQSVHSLCDAAEQEFEEQGSNLVMNIASIYVSAIDSSMEIYTVWKMITDMQYTSCRTGCGFIFYGGSSHAKVIKEMLLQLDCTCTFCPQNDASKACVFVRPSPQHQ